MLVLLLYFIIHSASPVEQCFTVFYFGKLLLLFLIGNNFFLRNSTKGASRKDQIQTTKLWEVIIVRAYIGVLLCNRIFISRYFNLFKELATYNQHNALVFVFSFCLFLSTGKWLNIQCGEILEMHLNSWEAWRLIALLEVDLDCKGNMEIVLLILMTTHTGHGHDAIHTHSYMIFDRSPENTMTCCFSFQS